MLIIREVYFGSSFRYIHSSGASFVFAFIFAHIARALHYGSYSLNPTIWNSGILLFFFLMIIAFIGYVLPFGSMSFWGATVITNLLSAFPCIIEWICGGLFVHNPTISRFFVFHFILPVILLAFILLHLFYLHQFASTNPLGFTFGISQHPFFPFIFSKDIFAFFFLIPSFCLQTFFGFLSFSHPDNAFEVSYLNTPQHIVPEWYFLSFYAILKSLPSKFAGFMIMLSFVFMLFIFMEFPKCFGTLLAFPFYHIYSFYFSFISSITLGSQLPLQVFIYYGRLLIIFMLICLYPLNRFPEFQRSLGSKSRGGAPSLLRSSFPFCLLIATPSTLFLAALQLNNNLILDFILWRALSLLTLPMVLIFLFLNNWFTDVVRESSKNCNVIFMLLAFAFSFFLFSELCFFISFFWASFHSTFSPMKFFDGVILPDPSQLSYANSLLLSNAAVSLACAFIERLLLICTAAALSSFIFASMFISLQIKEFRNMGFFISDFSLFYFLTGLHFFHVFVGIFFLSVLSSSNPIKINSQGFSSSTDYLFPSIQVLYWHFVEVLWLFISLACYGS
jgi:ubiquinol-cytochrome c reductase cytochrome b subunit